MACVWRSSEARPIRKGRGRRGSVNCPVKAVKNWLQAASITEGLLFRPVTKGGGVGNSRLTDRSVAGIIKTYARRLGLNEADFSGHSLRSGFLTSAARRGASVFKMRDVSRHALFVNEANIWTGTQGP
jgi:site-specific recombinase XerD